MILSSLLDSNIAKLFRECVKLAAIYDEGRRGSHFEVGRAMPLARADIFSCSDR
jgi:hypothetical protein